MSVTIPLPPAEFRHDRATDTCELRSPSGAVVRVPSRSLLKYPAGALSREDSAPWYELKDGWATLPPDDDDDRPVAA
jgi:hypothetical protein